MWAAVRQITYFLSFLTKNLGLKVGFEKYTNTAFQSKADNLTAILEPIVKVMWDPQRLTTLWAFTACYRGSFTLLTLLLF
jgi:hypothetical protein